MRDEQIKEVIAALTNGVGEKPYYRRNAKTNDVEVFVADDCLLCIVPAYDPDNDPEGVARAICEAGLMLKALLSEKPCRIKCAALKTKDGRIFEGRNHGICYQAMKEASVPRIPDARECEQGFVTEDGRFVDRYEAAEIALNAGQTKKLERPLFSEDLTGDWPWKQEKPCDWILAEDTPDNLKKPPIAESAWQISYYALEYDAEIPKIMTAAEIWLDEGSEVEYYKPIVLPKEKPCETCGGSRVRETALNGCVDIRWMNEPCPDCKPEKKDETTDGPEIQDTARK